MSKYCVVSVLGGWQTVTLGPTEKLIGPVFNDVIDLWNWQKENLNYEDLDEHLITEIEHSELEARLGI